jgi:hypothetical protein
VFGVVVLLAVPVGMMTIATATLLLAPSGQEDESNVPASPCLELADATPVDSLTAEQSTNARAIIAAGLAAKVPTRGLVVAIATALQESGLRNLDYGDRDSIGLFQQRRPWGTDADRMDPTTSATLFFKGGKDLDGPGPDGVEPGLLSISGWEQLGIAEAAQAVQRSAFPTAYAKWEQVATGTVATISGAAAVNCAGGDVEIGNCPRYQPASVEDGLTPDMIAVLRCGAQRFSDLRSWGCLARGGHITASDHYTGRACDIMIPGWRGAAGIAKGDEVAAYFQQNARAYGVTYIIWRAHIWNVDRAGEGWRPYTHPGGRTDPTALHMDHVHVSVHGSTGTYGWSST